MGIRLFHDHHHHHQSKRPFSGPPLSLLLFQHCMCECYKYRHTPMGCLSILKMSRQKLKNSISIINFDNTVKKQRRKVEMFPDVIRCGMFGPSGAGKSNLLLTILVHVRPFKNLYLCSKTSYQEKYNTLRELICSHNKGKKSSSPLQGIPKFLVLTEWIYLISSSYSSIWREVMRGINSKNANKN